MLSASVLMIHAAIEYLFGREKEVVRHICLLLGSNIVVVLGILKVSTF